jgi:hypothetical protein
MSSFKQLQNPNLDPYLFKIDKGVRTLLSNWLGWCLLYVQTAFSAGWAGKSAAQGWAEYAVNPHTDRNFPVGVYFPIWFKYMADLDGTGIKDWGHVVICFINQAGQMNIWSAPITTKPYADTWSSIEEVEQNYHCTFVGWSEGLGGTAVIEAVPDPAPAAPAVEINVTDVTPYRVTVAPGHELWDLDQPNWDAIISHAISVAPAEQQVIVAELTRSDLPQYKYLLTDRNVHHGYNSVDCKTVAIDIKYERLEKPINLIAAKDPTSKWEIGYSDYSTAVAVESTPKDTPIVAYGKATREDHPDQPVYYMTEADFGQADVTNAPNLNAGYNTVDVTLDTTPLPTPAAEVPSVQAEVATPDWQKSLKRNVADYRATQDYDVFDLASGTPVSTLPKGYIVHAAYRFEKPEAEGQIITYVMTQKSYEAGRFNGVPLAVLKIDKVIDIEPDEDDETVFAKIWSASEKAEKAIKQKVKDDRSFRDKVVAWLAKIWS